MVIFIYRLPNVPLPPCNLMVPKTDYSLSQAWMPNLGSQLAASVPIRPIALYVLHRLEFGGFLSRLW